MAGQWVSMLRYSMSYVQTSLSDHSKSALMTWLGLEWVSDSVCVWVCWRLLCGEDGANWKDRVSAQLLITWVALLERASGTISNQMLLWHGCDEFSQTGHTPVGGARHCLSVQHSCTTGLLTDSTNNSFTTAADIFVPSLLQITQ